MAARQFLPSNDEIDLAVKQVRLHRRPFVTLAEAVEEISRAVLPLGDTAWYVAYERMRKRSPRHPARHGPHFNYVVAADLKTASHLLERFAKSSQSFKEDARRLYRRNPHGPLQKASLNEIRGGLRPNRSAEFLLAAYQLLHTFRGEVDFIEGRVHDQLRKGSHTAPWLWVKTIPVYNNRLPDIRIYDVSGTGKPLSGRLGQQTKGTDASDQALVEWLLHRPPPEWIATMPVYDGPPHEATLRGFLSFPCRKDRKTALVDYLNDHYEHIQTGLTGAYWEGMRRYILDSFDEDPTYPADPFWCVDDPAQYWINQMCTFFGWRQATPRHRPKNDLYHINQQRADIFIGKILKNIEHVLGSAMTSREISDLADRHPGSLFLEYPPDNGPAPESYLLRHVHNAINLLNDILQKREMLLQRRNALVAARRAAMAAIMSRNMSHNIGSHVSPRTRLELVMDYLGNDTPKKAETAAHLKDRLDDLIQRKADFLAEITTEPLATTRPALFYREVIMPFIENTLLTDNLARNEGFGYEETEYTNGQGRIQKEKCGRNSLQISVRINGEKVVPVYFDKGNQDTIEVKDLPFSTRDNEGEALSFSIDNKCPEVEVALPGPLGEMAFYGFLENFVRNVAKHHRGIASELEIQIDVAEPEANEECEFYTIQISSNLWIAIEGSPEGKKLEDLFRKLEQGNRTAPPLLEQDIVLADGSLRKEAWGIAEMRICANLLRGSSDPSPKALRESLQVKIQREDGRVQLAYHFRMMKSKQVCIVSREISDSTTLRRRGIRVFQNLPELKAHLDASQSPESFKFAVIDCDGNGHEDLAILPDLLYRLPFRTLAVTGDEDTHPTVDELIRSGRVLRVSSSDLRLDFLEPAESRGADIDGFLAGLWRWWVVNRFPDADTHPELPSLGLELYFQQEQEAYPTQEWRRAAAAVSSTADSLQVRVWESKYGSAARPERDDGRVASRTIVLDRHAGAFNRIADLAGGGFDGMDKHAYMILDKKSPDFSLVFSPPFPDREKLSKWTLPWELCEAGLLRIVVADERVAERCASPADDASDNVGRAFACTTHPPTRFDVAWAAKVYVCTHLSIDGGNPVPLHPALESLSNKDQLPPRLRMHIATAEGASLGIGSPPAPSQVTFDYRLGCGSEGCGLVADMLVIHQGILDNFVSKDRGEQAAFLQTVNERIPYVVVDSGRGIPHTLNEKVKFIPFSLIQGLVMGDRIAKYSLTKIAMSLIRQR